MIYILIALFFFMAGFALGCFYLTWKIKNLYKFDEDQQAKNTDDLHSKPSILDLMR